MTVQFLDNSCLVLIDITKNYEDKIYNYDLFRKNIIKLIKKAKKEKIPVCFVLEKYKNVNRKNLWNKVLVSNPEDNHPDTMYQGIPMDFCVPDKNDYVFFKDGFDSFYKTGLEQFLKKNKVENLYIGGLATGVCVLNTIFSAHTRGFRNHIYLIENCCSDMTKARHESTLKMYKKKYIQIEEI